MKKLLKGFPIVLVLALSASACIKTNSITLANAIHREKISYESVAIYRTADQVRSKYEEVALINSSSTAGRFFLTEEKMYKSMQKKAAELGANGIILDAMSEPSAGAKVAAAFVGVGAQRKGRAIAIYVFPSKNNK